MPYRQRLAWCPGMTFSLLARDPVSGDFAAAAATGSLCVGGWVLRGDVRDGLSAAQGASASTLWGEAAQAALARGLRAPDALATVVGADPGRASRQLAVLDVGGWSAAFTGAANADWRGALAADDLVVSGNRLAGPAVLDALRDGWLTSQGEPLAERLLAALDAAAAAGGDRQPLQSAALLVLSRRQAPLTLRIDGDDRPLAALRALHARTTVPAYAEWAASVPCLDHPHAPVSAGPSNTGVLP